VKKLACNFASDGPQEKQDQHRGTAKAQGQRMGREAEGSAHEGTKS